MMLLGAACQATMPAASTPTVEATSTAQNTPETTVTSETIAHWEQVSVNGIQLAIEIPRGWDVQRTDDGLLIAEYFSTIESGVTAKGMQIHLFVKSLDGFKLPASSDANVAWAVLEQIIDKPEYIGNALVSAPAGFEWDGHDAAYYLLNNNDGNLSVLVAVALLSPKRLIVCNFSSPTQQASGIRAMLPQILSSLTINGVSMDITDLHNLPDPLNFPEAEATQLP
jgi:hypothetical protein